MHAFPPGRRVTVGDIQLSVHDAGEGPAVVMSHGFPELAWSWRHQFAPLTGAGFRAIAPDQRGYGESDRPAEVSDYDIEHLCGDLVGLLDALEIEKAVFVGHDWGGFVVWAMPALHPERCAGIVGVNTPMTPRSPVPPTQVMRAMFGGDDDKMYILWFQQPDVPERVLGEHVETVFDKLMRGGTDPAPRIAAAMASGEFDMNPFRDITALEPEGAPILSAEERATYVRAFEKSGFFGPVSWYRNFDRNWERFPNVGTTKIEVPCLMVTAQWDPVLRPEMTAGMDQWVDDLEIQQIDGCGHWTQQEKPAEFNAILLDWLRRKQA